MREIEYNSYAAIRHKIRLLKDFESKNIIVDDPFGCPEKYPPAYEKISLGCNALLKEIQEKFEN